MIYRGCDLPEAQRAAALKDLVVAGGGMDGEEAERRVREALATVTRR